jgi:hypothetical protein
MDYQKFVNNASFTIFVAVVLVLVTIVCIIFLKNGWKEAERLGVSKEELKKIVINCIGISLVPSIPIVLSVIVMVPVLGVALPWLRTSHLLLQLAKRHYKRSTSLVAVLIVFILNHFSRFVYPNQAIRICFQISIWIFSQKH